MAIGAITVVHHDDSWLLCSSTTFAMSGARLQPRLLAIVGAALRRPMRPQRTSCCRMEQARRRATTRPSTGRAFATLPRRTPSARHRPVESRRFDDVGTLGDNVCGPRQRTLRCTINWPALRRNPRDFEHAPPPTGLDRQRGQYRIDPPGQVWRGRDHAVAFARPVSESVPRMDRRVGTADPNRVWWRARHQFRIRKKVGTAQERLCPPEGPNT